MSILFYKEQLIQYIRQQRNWHVFTISKSAQLLC